ncbi:32493_t:CDS:2 [Racocetra persica]|uniref:32493_t:CDS:1 n=1 Tax=Racocetra persica TaxID=160502 RepID=A0ACA9NUI9_9GLOM|nr:32493_t:CDS:2 [Racocetra persica]
MDGRALFIRVIHGLIVLALLAVFGNNLYSLLQRVNKITQSFSVETKNALVPPALTFCITRQVAYRFSLELYGNIVATGTTPADYLSTYNNETVELKGLTNAVYKCWIIKTPDNSPVIINPSPNPLVDDIRFNYTRVFDTPGRFQPADPIVLNVFDPLRQRTNFEFSKFLLLDTDVNRAISFSRIESCSINRTVTTNIKYNIIDVFRDNLTMTTPNDATSSIRIRPDSFNLEITTDVQLIGPWDVLIFSVTLLGVLSGFYFALVGRDNEFSIQEEGRKENSNMVISEKTNEPSISETLMVYLDRFEHARYDR